MKIYFLFECTTEYPPHMYSLLLPMNLCCEFVLNNSMMSMNHFRSLCPLVLHS